MFLKIDKTFSEKDPIYFDKDTESFEKAPMK